MHASIYNSIVTHTYMNNNLIIHVCAHYIHILTIAYVYAISLQYTYSHAHYTTDAKRAIDQGTRLAAVIEDAQTGEIFSAPVGIAHKIAKTLKMV